jgi:DNA-binding LacI/PurR family transcriptional regulator
VTGPGWLPCVRRQSQRYVEVMISYGLEPRTVPGDFTVAGGVAGATAALRRWPRTDAIFGNCDATAIGALSVLRGKGVRVPHDVAVAGFDDIDFAAQTSPALTTATHPVVQIASTAALALLDPSSADGLPHVFGSELVLRETA